MIKEELEKEAREYLAEHSKYSEVFGEFFVAVDTLTAMLDFADPREKRIAELEKENAELKADNDARKFAMVMSEKVEKQLREENAELKKQLEMSNKVYNDNLDYSHHIVGNERGGEMTEEKKYFVYKRSGHYYTIDTKPVYEKVLFEGTDKECYEFVKKELENV